MTSKNEINTIKMAHKIKKVSSIRFGSRPGLKKFSENEKSRFHEL